MIDSNHPKQIQRAAQNAVERESTMFNFNTVMPDPKKQMAEHIVTEAIHRTISGNGQDLVENAIDVAFEPLEKAESVIKSIFGW